MGRGGRRRGLVFVRELGPGDLNENAVAPDHDAGACFARDSSRVAAGENEGIVGALNFGIIERLQLVSYSFVPLSSNRGAGPLLSYSCHEFTKYRYTSRRLRIPASNRLRMTSAPTLCPP